MTAKEAAIKLYTHLMSQNITPIMYGFTLKDSKDQHISITLYSGYNSKEDLDKIPNQFEGFRVEKRITKWTGW